MNSNTLDGHEIVVAAIAVLSVLGVLRRDPTTNALHLDPITAMQLGLRGARVEDQAAVLKVWASLSRSERANLDRNLAQLGVTDRAMLVTTLGAIPDPNDQLRVLTSLARLSTNQFSVAVHAFRITAIPNDRLDQVKRTLGYVYQWSDQQIRQKWPAIKAAFNYRLNEIATSIEQVNRKLERSLTEFERGIQERREKRKQRGFLGRLTGTNIKF
jgi:predicted ester cyclase